MKVTVLGSGSWGTTVASLSAHNNDVVLWARRDEVAAEINAEHTNSNYLDGYSLPANLRATSDLEQACAHAEVLVSGIPSQSFRSVLEAAQPHVSAQVPVVSLTKGLEAGTRLRMSQVAAEVFGEHPVAALTGPNLAKEIMSGCAAASVIACEDDALGIHLQRAFRTPMFRVYRNNDVIGSEFGGALKNVIALATGIAQGLSVGDNTRAAVITRGLAELTRLGVSMGGKPETFAGLAGMGDLIATCVSPQSRNRHVGEQLGLGRSLTEIIESMSNVAEGVKTAPVVMNLAAEHNLVMPVCAEVAQVIAGEVDARYAYRGLMGSLEGLETEAEPIDTVAE